MPTMQETLQVRMRKKSNAENEIAAIYEKIVYWKRNLFMLPTGANVSQHKYFLSSKLPLQRRCTLCHHYSYKSHPKDHVNVLERRLMSWMKGEFKKLFEETKAFQSRLPTNNGKRDKASTSMKLKVLMQKSMSTVQSSS